MEAFARAWWFLEPSSDEQLVVRWLSGLAAELGMADRTGTGARLTNMRGGGETTASAELEGVLDDIERLTGSRSPLKVRYTDLASGLIAQSNPNGRAFYSQISGVAHGESLALHGFVTDEAGYFEIYLPSRWGISYVTQILSSATFVTRKLLEALGRTEREVQTIAEAHDDLAYYLTSVIHRPETPGV